MMPDCNYVCRSCGLETCRDEAPSPCEPERICADCSPWCETHGEAA